MLGQTLGHYRIVDSVGAGGMGVVYRAHDERLDRDVALKVLPAGALADDQARKRFRNEALALSKLNHPNIASVFDFDRQLGVDFLVMELIRGVPLNAKLVAGPLDEKEVGRLGIQLANGLSSAHAEGVVHRDLKPSNILITPDGWLKILDFGVAKLLYPTPKLLETAQGETELAPWGKQQKGEAPSNPPIGTNAPDTRTVSGTLAYMSPEQLRGEVIDVRSDIWALGVVLYEMVCGELPFKAGTGFELSSKILREPLAPLPQQVSPGLKTIIERCLRKDAGQRYQNANEVRAALEAIASGEVRVAPGARGRPRPRWVTASLVVAGVFLAGMALLKFGGSREAPSAAGRRAENAAPVVQQRPPNAPRSVAILGFTNLSGRGDSAYLADVFSRMLTTELVGKQGLKTIPGESVTRMKTEVPFPDADSFATDTLAQVRNRLGADFVVHGSYVAVGGKVRLDLRLQDTGNPELAIAVSEIGREAELLDLVSRAGVRLRETLDRAQQQQLRDAALLVFKNGDLQGAVALLDRAIALDGPMKKELEDTKSSVLNAQQSARTFQDGIDAYHQGRYDEADKQFRAVLRMKGSQFESQAQRYLSEMIPNRRQEENNFAEAKQLSGSGNAADLASARAKLETVMKLDGPRKREAQSLHARVAAEVERLGKDAQMQALLVAGRQALIHNDYFAARSAADEIQKGGGDPTALRTEISQAESKTLGRLVNQFEQLKRAADPTRLEVLQGELRRFRDATGNPTANDLAESQIPAAIRRIREVRSAERDSAARVSLPSNTSGSPALMAAWPCPPIPLGAAAAGGLGFSPKPGDLVAAEMLDSRPAWVSCTMPSVSGTGTVRISLTIDENGGVVEIKPRGLQANQQLYDEVAQAARSWKTNPPRVRGIPAKTVLAYDIVVK